MDVQCERCRTEYEFDDALVSGRGTTVRCTSCGHQFKVRRLEGGSPAEDRWVVKTLEGQELSFFALRDLQQAISSKRLTPSDVLIQGGRQRALGSITELEPFFGGKASVPPPGTGRPAGNDASSTFASPRHARPWNAPEAFESATAPSMSARAPSFDAVQEKPGTLRPPPTAAAVPPPATLVYPQQARVMPPPTAPVRSAAYHDEFADEEFGEPRSKLPSSDESYSFSPPRRRVGGWVVVFALLVAVGVVGWAAVRPYFAVHESAAAAHLDTRAQSLLADGESALADGNLELSQEDFDKASVLAEKDPRVLLDQARLAAVKADVPWLKMRLLAADATDDLRTTRAELDDLTARAVRMADRAEAAAPDDTAALRAKIDARRLAGDVGAARAGVSRILARAAQPETAYVLALVDLAEPEPLWATAIERLRLAVVGEVRAGRARAVLIYALAKSGDIDGAKAELTKLGMLPRPFPLLPALHAFVDRLSPKTSPVASEPTMRIAPAAATPRAPTVASQVAAPPEASGDTKTMMQAASQAIRKGDYARARQLYNAIVERNPNDSEALSGLGDVARQQGNLGGAIAEYRRAIAVNPSYLPALLGLADSEWASGERSKAIHDYSDIVDRFPEGTYPGYVAKRVPSSTVSDPGATEKP